MTMPDFQNLEVELVPTGITVLRINRPKALNALNTETLNELKIALLAISQDPQTRVLVLTGAGEKAFIAGADISEMKDLSNSEGVVFSQLGHDVAKLLETMAIPTIAAVNGFALGGGTEMALACDFILASDKAVFGQPEVSLGIIPGFGGCFRLARAVGWAKAKYLIYSGARIKSDEAMAMGLCVKVFPAEGFMSEVLKIAQTISAQSSSAVRKAKQLMVEFSETSGLHFKIDGESHSFARLMGSVDQREGMSAFSEKRPAKFEGL
jgi:enoyl-CoA hydratase